MKTCPSCKQENQRLLSLSRKDNKTLICDNCGSEEAMAKNNASPGSLIFLALKLIQSQLNN